MEQDLGWNRTTLIGALTVASLVSAATGLVAGGWFDRRGARLGMTLSALFGGVTLILLAFVSTPWQYYLLLGLGVGATRMGLENLGPRTVISNWFVRRRAAAFAWFSGGRAVFGVTAVAPIAYLVANTSWRVGWALLGIVELVVLVPLLWIVIRRRPEDHGQLPDGAAPEPASAMGSPQARPALPGEEKQWTRAEAMRTRTFWMLAAAYVLTGFPTSGMIANMLPYFQDEGLTLVTGSYAFTMFGFGALVGRPVWGYVASRAGIHASLTAYGLIYGMVIGGFDLASSALFLFPAAFLLGVPTGGAAQLQAQVWADYFGRRHVGSITGVTVFLTTPTTAAGPLVAAIAFDLAGNYDVVFAAYAILAFSAGILFYLAKRPAKHPVRHHTLRR